MADTGLSVIIYGETGVGKEVVARELHRRSNRQKKRFVKVNCAALPSELMESELFGYEKGALTGAERRKIGRLELAHQGTLFIDEIGELSTTTQIKLLRVLQEKTFTRIGGTKTIRSDFRLIRATNRDLEKELLKGKFRQDLYYRINVIFITIPPIRERPEDIILLAEYFIAFFTKKHNRTRFQLNDNDQC